MIIPTDGLFIFGLMKLDQSFHGFLQNASQTDIILLTQSLKHVFKIIGYRSGKMNRVLMDAGVSQ